MTSMRGVKRQPGIVDPWRQKTTELEKPMEAVRVVDGRDMDGGADTPTPTPLRFAGRNAGLIVRVSGDDLDKMTLQARTNVLVAIHALMRDHSLDALFQSWGLVKQAPSPSADPWTQLSDGTRSVSVRGDFKGALDAIAQVFRGAVRMNPSVDKYLLSLGIRPYIT